MANLIDKKIVSVRFHAAANIANKELNSVTPGKEGVVFIDFALVEGECVGVYIFSKHGTKEFQDVVPMGDIIRIRVESAPEAPKAEPVKAATKAK